MMSNVLKTAGRSKGLRSTALAAALMLIAGSAFAQQREPEQAAKPMPQREGKPAEGPAKPSPDAMQPINVRIELTITDQRGESAPVSNAVSLIASDRSWSRLRTGGDMRTPQGVFPVILNVDARPILLARESNRARVELTIEYRPNGQPFVMNGPGTPPETDKTTPNINESLSVILEDGKSMLISQSADPVTDRKVKVEVKATILK
jgi:hypothetical protein